MRKLLFTFAALFLAWNVSADTFTVSNTLDGNVPGTLWRTIDSANANPGLDFIVFDIPTSLPLPVVIKLKSSLPKITDPVVIDGNTQSGTVAVGNKIVIEGITQQNAVLTPELFVFYLTSAPAPGGSASGSTIRNITIDGLDHQPISGPTIQGPSTYAVRLDGVDDCDLRNLILKDVDGNGVVFINGADNNKMFGCILGTDATLSTNEPVDKPLTIGTFSQGILNDGNQIGGLNPGQRNFFYNMPTNTGGWEVIEVFWGRFNRISNNEFVNNWPSNIAIDGTNAPWCLSINECKVPPASLNAELITQGLQVSGISSVGGNASVGDTVEIFTSDATGKDALVLLGIAIVPPSGLWSVTLQPQGVQSNDWLVLTTSNTTLSTSAFSKVQVICNNSVPTISGINGGGNYTIDLQAGIPICFTISASDFDNDPINFWSPDFTNVWPNGSLTIANDNTPNPTATVCLTPLVSQAGTQLCFTMHAADSLICGYDFTAANFCINVIDTLGPCPNCIESFQPLEGKRYVVTAWAREFNPLLTKTSFDQPEIYIDFPGFGSVGPFVPSGEIIDGWQRIEGEFTIPVGATEFKLRLQATSGEVYFDDVRVFPFDAHMVNYVYDLQTMRLMAELDERHYATFYEYDEEGKLMRVKKETEKGIMTLQETRQNTPK